jgi:putative endonuclease
MAFNYCILIILLLLNCFVLFYSLYVLDVKSMKYLKNACNEKVSMYILKLKSGLFYCGITNNVERRYKEHSEGKKSWASKVGVVKIVYVKTFDDRRQAVREEKRVKVFGVSKFVKYLRLTNQLK